MSRSADHAKRLIALVIVAGVAFFFYREFRRNWAAMQAAKLELDYTMLCAAAVLVLGASLLSTQAWHATVNGLSMPRKLSFKESVAAMNASGLAKYLPGKFWTYALQMYWLGAAGFSKSLVLYANLVNLVISVLVTLILGLTGLLLSQSQIPALGLAVALAVVLIGDLVAIRFYSALFSSFVRLAGRLLKREIQYFQLSLRLTLELHAVHLGGAILHGFATYLVCLGIGFEISAREACLVISASMVSDVAGFLAFVVPGGLGVREGVMYLLLEGISTKPLQLVLPVASRVVSMLVDILLGAVALKLLRTYAARGWSSAVMRPDVGAG
jgi:hypothetical protein